MLTWAAASHAPFISAGDVPLSNATGPGPPTPPAPPALLPLTAFDPKSPAAAGALLLLARGSLGACWAVLLVWPPPAPSLGALSSLLLLPLALALVVGVVATGLLLTVLLAALPRVLGVVGVLLPLPVAPLPSVTATLLLLLLVLPPFWLSWLRLPPPAPPVPLLCPPEAAAPSAGLTAPPGPTAAIVMRELSVVSWSASAGLMAGSAALKGPLSSAGVLALLLPPLEAALPLGPAAPAPVVAGPLVVPMLPELAPLLPVLFAPPELALLLAVPLLLPLIPLDWSNACTAALDAAVTASTTDASDAGATCGHNSNSRFIRLHHGHRVKLRMGHGEQETPASVP